MLLALALSCTSVAQSTDGAPADATPASEASTSPGQPEDADTGDGSDAASRYKALHVAAGARHSCAIDMDGLLSVHPIGSDHAAQLIVTVFDTVTRSPE
jgi:hypothetical protein